MNDRIDRVFRGDQRLRVMTHVVAGYPDMESCEEVMHCMIRNKVDMIEVQIPFSDPLADGEAIMRANQKALDQGTTPGDCFDLVARVTKESDTPVLFMTYANIPYRMGMERFVSKASQAGASGLIIPDLPYDEDCNGYYQIAAEHGICPIYVVSPDTAESRLKAISERARGFIYTTLKTGITGARDSISSKGIDFIEVIRKYTEIPVAAGFGISSLEHLGLLENKADMGIIGSHLINLYSHEGIEGVSRFLEAVQVFLSSRVIPRNP